MPDFPMAGPPAGPVLAPAAMGAPTPPMAGNSPIATPPAPQMPFGAAAPGMAKGYEQRANPAGMQAPMAY